MKTLLYTLTLFAITLSTNQALAQENKKLRLNQIQDIYFEYDSTTPINFGSEIPAKIIAELKNGQKIDVSNDKRVQLRSKKIAFRHDKLYISGTAGSVIKDSLSATILYKKKSRKRLFKEGVVLNHKGPIVVNGRGNNGNRGKDGSTDIELFDVFFRTAGYDGYHGLDGGEGKHLTVQVWREDSTVFVLATNRDSEEKMLYKSTTDFQCIVDVSGGRGGKGGLGSDGSNGVDGECPGDGDDGGEGGNGGNGGQGGYAEIIVHTNASDLMERIEVIYTGGNAGAGGSGGDGGNGGNNTDIGLDGFDGADGKRGDQGKNGEIGQEPFFRIKSFSIPHYGNQE